MKNNAILNWYIQTTCWYLTEQEIYRNFKNNKVILKKLMSIRNYFGIKVDEDIDKGDEGYIIIESHNRSRPL